MAGIGDLGLALSILGTIVQVVDTYQGRVTSREIYLLSQSLKNSEKIFLNALEELLSPIVTPAELGRLLEKPDGELWSDKILQQKIETFFASRGESELIETAAKIVETVGKLQKSLPPLIIDPNSKPQKSLVERGKKVIKIFVKGPSQKASLDRLHSLVEDFCRLADQGRRLRPIRRASRKPFGNLRLLQDRARDLHRLLRDSGWNCDCAQPHPARLQLEVWQDTQQGDIAETTRFRFLFSVACPTEEATPEGRWRYAEIVPLSPSGGRQDSVMTLENSDAQVIYASPVPATSSTGFPRASGESSSTSDIRKPSGQVRFDLGNGHVDHEQADHGPYITDLCDFLKSIESAPEAKGTCLGHLGGSRSHPQKFGLYRASDQAFTPPPVVLPLREIFPRSIGNSSSYHASATSGFTKLTTADRVQLALKLGWNVLQLHSTPWLEQYWTKDDIFLITAQPKSVLPYVTHEFHSSRRASLSSTTSIPRVRLTKWVRDDALFRLGVLLIELCLDRTLADLAEDEDGGREVMTAMRLSNNLECKFGYKFEDAVHACIHCKFGSYSSDPEIAREQFQMGVYENIIKPLEEAAKVHIRPCTPYMSG